MFFRKWVRFESCTPNLLCSILCSVGIVFVACGQPAHPNKLSGIEHNSTSATLRTSRNILFSFGLDATTHRADSQTSPISALLLHSSGVSCEHCTQVFTIFIAMKRLGATTVHMKLAAKILCGINLQIDGEARATIQRIDICNRAVELYAEQFAHIMWANNSMNDVGSLCGYMLMQTPTISGDSEKQCQVQNWMIWHTLLPPKPPPLTLAVANAVSAARRRLLPGSKQKTFLRLLIISDLHIDPAYKFDSVASCNSLHCCQAESETLANTAVRYAGQWGDVGQCDLPIQTLKSSLELLRANGSMSNFDGVLVLGDQLSHNFWQHDRDFVRQQVTSVLDVIKQHFNDSMVVPVVGNHDISPLNMFVINNQESLEPAEFQPSWLYSTMYDNVLLDIVQTPAAVGTFLAGGYYSFVLAASSLRVIILNTNHCFQLDLWWIRQIGRKDAQLDWLVEELTNAERLAQSVLVVGHINPLSNECLKVWQLNFMRIVERFHTIIVASVFGHDHNDAMDLITRRQQALSVVYTVGAMTPYADAVPTMKIFDFAQNSQNRFEVADIHSYVLDLPVSNNDSRLHWRAEYSAQRDFHLTSLTAASWYDFLNNRIQHSSAAFQLFMLLQLKRASLYNYNVADRSENTEQNSFAALLKTCSELAECRRLVVESMVHDIGKLENALT